MLLAKAKLNTIEVLIFKALIDFYINHYEFVSINNVLREYNEKKEEIQNPNKFCRIYFINTMKTYFVSCKKNSANENSSIRKTNKIDYCFYQILLFVLWKN